MPIHFEHFNECRSTFYIWTSRALQKQYHFEQIDSCCKKEMFLAPAFCDRLCCCCCCCFLTLFLFLQSTYSHSVLYFYSSCSVNTFIGSRIWCFIFVTILQPKLWSFPLQHLVNICSKVGHKIARFSFLFSVLTLNKGSRMKWVKSVFNHLLPERNIYTHRLWFGGFMVGLNCPMNTTAQNTPATTKYND